VERGEPDATTWYGLPIPECCELARRAGKSLWQQHGGWCDPSDYEAETWGALALALSRYPDHQQYPFQIFVWLQIRQALWNYARQRREGREIPLLACDERIESSHEAYVALDWQLQRLRPSWRKAIIAVYCEGRTVGAYSQEIGTSPGTVKQYLCRGMTQLRRQWEEEGMM
jgi:RNA polymerase sigma factor (sigma-70 family)